MLICDAHKAARAAGSEMRQRYGRGGTFRAGDGPVEVLTGEFSGVCSWSLLFKSVTLHKRLNTQVCC